MILQRERYAYDRMNSFLVSIFDYFRFSIIFDLGVVYIISHRL